MKSNECNWHVWASGYGKEVWARIARSVYGRHRATAKKVYHLYLAWTRKISNWLKHPVMQRLETSSGPITGQGESRMTT